MLDAASGSTTKSAAAVASRQPFNDAVVAFVGEHLYQLVKELCRAGARNGPVIMRAPSQASLSSLVNESFFVQGPH
jgi:hypothetical protein